MTRMLVFGWPAHHPISAAGGLFVLHGRYPRMRSLIAIPDPRYKETPSAGLAGLFPPARPSKLPPLRN